MRWHKPLGKSWTPHVQAFTQVCYTAGNRKCSSDQKVGGSSPSGCTIFYRVFEVFDFPEGEFTAVFTAPVFLFQFARRGRENLGECNPAFSVAVGTACRGTQRQEPASRSPTPRSRHGSPKLAAVTPANPPASCRSLSRRPAWVAPALACGALRTNRGARLGPRGGRLAGHQTRYIRLKFPPCPARLRRKARLNHYPKSPRLSGCEGHSEICRGDLLACRVRGSRHLHQVEGCRRREFPRQRWKSAGYAASLYCSDSATPDVNPDTHGELIGRIRHGTKRLVESLYHVEQFLAAI